MVSHTICDAIKQLLLEKDPITKWRKVVEFQWSPDDKSQLRFSMVLFVGAVRCISTAKKGHAKKASFFPIRRNCLFAKGFPTYLPAVCYGSRKYIECVLAHVQPLSALNTLFVFASPLLAPHMWWDNQALKMFRCIVGHWQAWQGAWHLDDWHSKSLGLGEHKEVTVTWHCTIQSALSRLSSSCNTTLLPVIQWCCRIDKSFNSTWEY